MKGSETKPVLPRKWAMGRRLRLSGGMILLRDCILVGLTGFLLAAVRIMGLPAPIAACLTAAFLPGFRCLSATAGAVGGYLLFTEGAQCAEFVAVSLMMLAAVVVFQGTELPAKPLFFPAMAAGVCGILKGIGLLGGADLGQWLFHCGLCAAFSAVFRRMVAYDRRAALVGISALLCALSALPLPVDLGLVCAAALCLALGSAQATVAFGIAIDLTGQGAACACIALCLPALLLQKLRKKSMILYAAGFLLLSSLIHVIFKEAPAASCLSLSLGTALGLGLQKLPAFSEDSGRSVHNVESSKLRKAAQVLQMLRRQLPEDKAAPCEHEAESVYDGAAERICRCCSRFHRCWESRAEETCHALSTAARGIIERGIARGEDFPLSFRENCCHLEGFVIAVNQELEGMLFRRRYRVRLRESRQIVAQELECLEEYLLAMDDYESRRHSIQASYLPEVGVCSMGKKGTAVSGDRSRCFAGIKGEYFILLCDGMGTGEAAYRMSGETIYLLERMLKSGMVPESALKLLNGTELLRGDDRFTTIDLLCINLKNGQAVLHKWGSAPSYYRKGEEVKKIGTAAPPPGVGVGGEHVPERFELSLIQGEMLVLTSDGAGGEETEEALKTYSGNSPRELAAYLISGMAGEDDMTAVTVSLRLHTSSS